MTATMKVKRIEIAFAVSVELTSEYQKILCQIVQNLAKSNTSEGMVHWQFGMVSTFNDEVFFIETACREKNL